MSRPAVHPGTITVFTDVACIWSTVALHRFYEARRAAGLDDELAVDHQLFLLEDVNESATDMSLVEGEKPVAGALVEELGFKPWQRHPGEWPVTSFLANEAVHAVKAHGFHAAEQLDMALRLAFFRDSRCISMLHEVLDIASECAAVDVARLRTALETGQARGPMVRTYRECRDSVQVSPHFFLADGSDAPNPGVQLHEVGESGAGFLVVDSDDPTAYAELVRRAAAA